MDVVVLRLAEAQAQGLHPLGSQPQRDIVGNPFRTVSVADSWLTWNGSTIRRVAQVIYHEGRWEDMPILGDALEDAGCLKDVILSHCRNRALHLRGCWLLDLLLGRS